MSKRYRLVPRDLEGNLRTDVSKYPDIWKMVSIAEKRTHRFALETISNFPSGVTIKQALAAAYLQGISDTVLLLDKQTGE